MEVDVDIKNKKIIFVIFKILYLSSESINDC